MKCVFIFGPQAVGKMTVGHALERITPLKLFHNHMTIELLSPYLGFSEDMWRLSDQFRQQIFEAVAKSDADGLIFTYVWALDSQADWDFVEKTSHIFTDRGGEVCFVELQANLDERLRRNTTSHRLEHKPSKRDVARSEADLRRTMNRHRLNSDEG